MSQMTTHSTHSPDQDDDADYRTRVRLNVERTSTGKYRTEKTITLTDVDITSPVGEALLYEWIRKANAALAWDVLSQTGEDG